MIEQQDAHCRMTVNGLECRIIRAFPPAPEDEVAGPHWRGLDLQAASGLTFWIFTKGPLPEAMRGGIGDRTNLTPFPPFQD